jgi:hypothetical protein
MKTFIQFSLVSLAFLALGATSCTKDDIDTTTAVELPEPIDTIVVADPIYYRVSSSSQQRVADGQAYSITNGDNTFYVLASNNVSVECPGGLATSFDGGEDYFQFHFIQTPDNEIVFLSSFNSIVDSNTVTLFATVPPTCVGAPFEIDYQLINDRISGTITGEFFYINPVYVPPFENCDNFVSVGLVDVSFDLPLKDCN